ncbi:hypothetical protein Bca4012_059558 [Brassica carinata]
MRPATDQETALLKARFGPPSEFSGRSQCADCFYILYWKQLSLALFGDVLDPTLRDVVDAPRAEPREPENAKEDDEPQSQWVDQAPPLHQTSTSKFCLKKPGDEPSSISSSDKSSGLQE